MKKSTMYLLVSWLNIVCAIVLNMRGVHLDDKKVIAERTTELCNAIKQDYNND